jgi:hypothetical protein
MRIINTRKRLIISISIKQVFSALIAIALIELVLWQMIGSYSFYFLLLVPVVVIFLLSVRKIRFGRP